MGLRLLTMDQQKNNISSQFLRHHNEAEERKKKLFLWIGYFLLVDATCFFGLLLRAFVVVGEKPATWHLFTAPALAGGIGAIVSVFLVKSIYNTKQEKEDVALPSFEAIKEITQDLSQ